MPAVLSTARVRPRVVPKTEGTLSPNAARSRLANKLLAWLFMVLL